MYNLINWTPLILLTAFPSRLSFPKAMWCGRRWAVTPRSTTAFRAHRNKAYFEIFGNSSSFLRLHSSGAICIHFRDSKLTKRCTYMKRGSLMSWFYFLVTLGDDATRQSECFPSSVFWCLIFHTKGVAHCQWKLPLVTHVSFVASTYLPIRRFLSRHSYQSLLSRFEAIGLSLLLPTILRY